MNSSGTSAKSALRASIRARRTARIDASRADSGGAPALYAEHVAKLVRAVRPAAVVGYAALPGEPSLDAALTALLDSQTPVLLPATRKGEPLQLGHVTGPLDDLPRGTWGIREPDRTLPAPEALARAADTAAAGAGVGAGAGAGAGAAPILVLVPGLAYDTRGVRLGNGGGFYDRTFGPQGQFAGGVADGVLAPLRARLRFVGVCWDDERTDDLPRAAWDLTVGAVLTESGLHRVTSDT
ncbi:MAG: 5-formyltetrahydrofolate cyclo-ligase [Brevibacterium yomogidense]|uniref:5-formyltetrahydrofolate cyclo-ligase n=1 Tax=Brevibacterium yomogidense TaxID=946573 RepID=A0A1X6X8I8_9MICO|nr:MULTISPECIES: 5-formyltetrahydrofolate cyclo-ligase [Brevibacterium]SLM95562.1 5-formyltetrahydrofolate cyclo-ligase [Brevibacterium yomogidense]SMX72204.1 5-formyltetrahydrofolate cyclo-ligase [Brevibacterium sp. Mu109]